MGEDIEIRDVNGNLVKVPLYPTISACGRQVQGQVMVNCGDGTRVVIFRERIPTVEAREVHPAPGADQGAGDDDCGWLPVCDRHVIPGHNREVRR